MLRCLSRGRPYLAPALYYEQARNVRGEDYKRALRESLHKYMKLSTLNEESASADKRKDTISHFILRLAYCRSEDLRRWFLTQVCAAFVYMHGVRCSACPRGCCSLCVVVAVGVAATRELGLPSPRQHPLMYVDYNDIAFSAVLETSGA